MIKEAIATIALIGFGMWTILAGLLAPIQVPALDHWLTKVIVVLAQVGLIYGAFRLGMYHALEVPLHRLAIGVGTLGVAVAGLWYLQAAVGVPLMLTLMAFTAAGDRFKEGELRERADEEDSNGGWTP